MSQLWDILLGPREKQIIASAFLAFAFFYFDPLELGPQKAQSIDNWISWFGQYRYISKARDNLAVILIDEESLRGWQMDWPITYGQISSIIHQLACARVTGVYFDFTLTRRYNLADGADDLLRSINDSSSTGPLCADGNRPSKIAVFFSKIAGTDSSLSREVARSDRAFWIQTEAPTNIYPATTVEFPDHPVDDNDVTPAFGILRNVCKTHEQAGSFVACSLGTAAFYSTKPIRLVWNGAVDPKQALISDASSCRQPLSWWQMPVVAAGWSGTDFYQPCTPILTLIGSDLYRDYAYISTHGDPAQLLADRIVLVGTSLSGLNDSVISPVHGRLPGVYQHAVAIDNLATFGNRYRKEPTPAEKYISVAAIYLLSEAARVLVGRKSANVRAKEFLRFASVGALFAAFTVFVVLNDWPVSLAVVTIAYYLGPAFVYIWAQIIPRGTKKIGRIK